MQQVPFAQSEPFTLGVELEFQILDRLTLELVPRAAQLLSLLPDPVKPRVAYEFLQSVFEVQTGICRNVEDVERDLRRTIAMVEEAAEKSGSLLFASGVHPFSRPGEQKVTNSERYVRIMDELQLVGRQFIAQGLHVHVGMPDGESAVRVADVVQAYLPLLLGLSASSPFFAGEDTGLCSYRTKLFEALPMAGIAEYHGSWKAYEEEILMLQNAGIIREIRDLWWDVRPSPSFGTVEIRICDMPARFSDMLALTGLIQALIVFIAERGINAERVNPQLLRYNKWQACRYGLEGDFCDPFRLLSPVRRSLRWSVERMLHILAPQTARLDMDRRRGGIRAILDRGTGTDRQRLLLAETGSLTSMIERLHGEFWS